MTACTRRYVAALLLALVAVLIPVTAGGAAVAGPVLPGSTAHSPAAPAAQGPGATAEPGATPSDGPGATAGPGPAAEPGPEPVASGMHATPSGRAVPATGAPDHAPDHAAAAEPGPALDAQRPAMPGHGPRGPDGAAPAGRGHGAALGSRGPPTA